MPGRSFRVPAVSESDGTPGYRVVVPGSNNRLERSRVSSSWTKDGSR